MTRPRRWTLATRLIAGLTLVVVAGGATTAVVALLVGPQVFHEHLVAAGLGGDPAVLAHVEEAYATASLLSVLPVTALVVVISALVVWLATRPLRASLTELTNAASVVSLGGHPDVLPDRRAGAEIDTLTRTFNTMAADLADSERARRRLLADLAHELRTPVANLQAWTESLEDGITPWGPEAAAVLTAQGARLTRLAGDLEDLSRIDEDRLALDRRPVRVGALVTDAITSLTPAATAAGVSVRADGEEAAFDMVLLADAGRIGQILANLLTNGLRHTPAGGQVVVTVSATASDVRIAVCDSGGGIPVLELPHVFDRFYRGAEASARDSRGSGLGLTISRALARAHGGDLVAANADGGAVLTLTLPR